MKKISAASLQKLISESRVLEADGLGPKVLEANDGKRIYKLFRRKRWLSSALLYPYAARFAHNAQRLRSLGFNTVNVLDISHCPGSGYHLVSYEKVIGESLRDLVKMEPRIGEFVDLGRFIARLHRLGVYFRSLHLGNLLRDENNEFVLIDIADMKFYSRPLSASQRRRNFRPLLNRVDDRTLISPANWRALVSAYGESAGLETAQLSAIEELGVTLLAQSATAGD